jgi:hypothetical protein
MKGTFLTWFLKTYKTSLREFILSPFMWLVIIFLMLNVTVVALEIKEWGFTILCIVTLIVLPFLINLLSVLVVNLPKYILEIKIKDIRSLIHEIFGESFNEDIDNLDKGTINRFKNLMISEEQVSIWLFRLKCHRQRLVTLVPIASTVLYVGTIPILGKLGGLRFVKELLQLLYLDSLYQGIFSRIYLLVWLLIVYQSTVQETNEMIFKLEFLREIRSVRQITRHCHFRPRRLSMKRIRRSQNM